MVQMDISTVSVWPTAGRTDPYGTFLLKSFSESLTTETGEEVSSREVKKISKKPSKGKTSASP